MRQVVLFALLIGTASLSARQGMIPSPDRRAGEGAGPFTTLVIRGVTVIDGSGAPGQKAMFAIRRIGTADSQFRQLTEIGSIHRMKKSLGGSRREASA